MGSYIDIKKLTLDELAGVVNLYPWFGGARKELCERMNRMGGEGWGESQYADAAMYVGAREKLADLVKEITDVIPVALLTEAAETVEVLSDL